MRIVTHVLSVLLISTLLCGTSATAQQTTPVQVSGTIVYALEQTYDTLQLPNGNTLDRHAVAGTFSADDANEAPFQRAVVDASVTALYNADGQWVRSTGHGELVDKDGDVCWFWTKNLTANTRSGIIGGTGKFKGCSGSGTFTLIDQLPDARHVYRFRGTLQMQKPE